MTYQDLAASSNDNFRIVDSPLLMRGSGAGSSATGGFPSLGGSNQS